MPARDIYHDCVRNALTKDGWTITHDPLHLAWGARDLYVDLGAQSLLAAERPGSRIAVEVKSFLSRSDMADLHVAVGQFTLYNLILSQTQPDRVLYLAVTIEVHREVFEDPIGKLLLENDQVRLLVFDPELQALVQWIPPRDTGKS